MRRRGVPFQDELILPVAVDIAHRTVVGGIFTALGAGSRTVEFQRQEFLRPRSHFGRCRHGLAVDLSYDLILGRGRTLRVLIVRDCQVAGYDFAVAQQVELRLLVVSTQQAPADEELLAEGAGGDGHQTSVKLLHLADRSDLCLCLQKDGCQYSQDVDS